MNLAGATKIINDRARFLLESKGHIHTGALERSIEERFTETLDGYVAETWGEEYGLAQETGIRPGNVKAGRLYLEAIAEWALSKGMVKDIARPMGIAFAIATTHKRVGMHSKGGSLDKTKQGWISEAIEQTTFEVDREIEAQGFALVDLWVEKMIDETKRNIIL